MNPLAAIELRERMERNDWDALSKGVDDMGNLDTALKDRWASSDGARGSDEGVFGMSRLGKVVRGLQEQEAEKEYNRLLQFQNPRQAQGLGGKE